MARAARITRGQVVFAILLAFLASTALAVLKAEAGPLLGLPTPEISMLLASFEVTTWLDVISGALLVATAVRWRGSKVRGFAVRRAGRRDNRASTACRSKRAPANDDDRPALTA